jgi:hypothetical protein
MCGLLTYAAQLQKFAVPFAVQCAIFTWERASASIPTVIRKALQGLSHATADVMRKAQMGSERNAFT